MSLTRRQRTLLVVMRWCAGHSGWCFRFLVGRDNLAEFLTVMITTVMPDPQETLHNAARVGAVRPMQDLQQRLSGFAAQIRPDSPWCFHKDQWGHHEVCVMPRVIDSNTGVVVGPSDNQDLGSVLTNDGLPPNCEPAALNQILYGGPAPSMPIEGGGVMQAMPDPAHSSGNEVASNRRDVE